MRKATITNLVIAFSTVLLLPGRLSPQTCQEQVSSVNVQLTSASSMDLNSGWVCGYSGTVLRSTNVGNTWLNVSGNGIPSNVSLVNIFSYNRDTALTAGYISTTTYVYRTTNAGANWVQVFTQANGFINGVWIRMDRTGFMAGDPVGGRWSLWRTTNTGATWDSSGMYLPQAGAEAGWNNSLVLAQTRIWFGTNNSRIYYSSNNGLTWNIQSSSPEVSIYSIWFDGGGMATGYAGGVNVLKTTNYGNNWVSIGSLGTGNVVGIVYAPFTSAPVSYVKSGNDTIYWGNGMGFWSWQCRAQTGGTFRHLTVARVGSACNGGNHWGVRTNGGITYQCLFFQAIEPVNSGLPERFFLEQNYPNPFNAKSKIKYQISEISFVRLTVYDVLGREVTTLVNETLLPATYEIQWDAEQFSSGVYYYKLTAGDYSETRKMVLIK